MAGIAAAMSAPLALSRIASNQSYTSHHSRTSRYTDPWTEPLDDELSRPASPVHSEVASETSSELDPDELGEEGAAGSSVRSRRGGGHEQRRKKRRKVGEGEEGQRDNHEFLHPRSTYADGQQRRSFDLLGIPLRRSSTQGSSKSAVEVGEGSGTRRRGWGWGWSRGGEEEGEEAGRSGAPGGEVAIEMLPPESPGTRSLPPRSPPPLASPPLLHLHDHQHGRGLEHELGVEEDIPEDEEADMESVATEEEEGEGSDAGRGDESRVSVDASNNTTPPRNPDEEVEHIGALSVAAEEAGKMEREEVGMERDIEHDEEVDREIAAAEAEEAAEARDKVASPRVGLPPPRRGRRREWLMHGRSKTLPASMESPEHSPSPPPGHHRRKLFKYGEHKRNMKLTRTMSMGSSFSLESARKRSVGFLFRIWLAIFPPEGEDKGFIPNYRYTPILSGIVVPFAILLEIPGLTEHWYIRTENNVTVDFQSNPLILDIGLAFSMAAGVIANLALVARFLERRVLVSTIVATVALAIHDIINIVTVTVFGVIHRFNDGFTYGEAFWITVCSTIASTFVNVTLIYDLVKTKDFSRSGSGLTAKQRSLVIVVMLLICYIALGALVNAFANGLSFQDAMYFTIVTIETIGFGDIAPQTIFAKIFICFYLTFGILNLALAVGTTRETIIESFENAYRIRRAKIHQRRKEHREARKRQQEEEDRLREMGLLPRYVNVRTGRGGATTKIVPVLPNGAMVQSPISENPASPNAMTHPPGSTISALFTTAVVGAAPTTASTLVAPHTADGIANGHSPGLISLPESSTVVPSGPPTADGTVKEETFLTPGEEAKKLAAELRGDLNHTDRRSDQEEESYLEFKKRMEKEETREFYTKVAIAWSLFFVFWMAGAAIFSKTEEWTFATGMYFCFITFTTLGYGDFAPQSPAGRAIFCVWALAGVAAMTILIAVLTEAYSSRYKTVVVRHGMLDRAVKHMHDQQAKEEANLRNHLADKEKAATPSPRVSFDADTPLAMRYDSVSRSMDKAQKELEALPAELLKQAKTLHEHLNFLSKPPHGADMPPMMQKMIDDIAEAEKLDARMKHSLLEDDEARRTLFMMSYEKSLNSLISSAEKAVELLARREQKHQVLDRLHRLTLEREMTLASSSGPDATARELYRPQTQGRHLSPKDVSGPMEPRPYDPASESMRRKDKESASKGGARKSLSAENLAGKRKARPKVRIDVSGLGGVS